LPEGTALVTMHCISFFYVRPWVEFSRVLMNIGETIRNFRLQRSMSQGDIEKRTGLLRCYLSRVENGHTIPSLDTLAKIAGAMDLALSQFFSEGASNGHQRGCRSFPTMKSAF
jgi:ribosome-binding protein aMBF1 (putative translation factor)